MGKEEKRLTSSKGLQGNNIKLYGYLMALYRGAIIKTKYLTIIPPTGLIHTVTVKSKLIYINFKEDKKEKNTPQKIWNRIWVD